MITVSLKIGRILCEIIIEIVSVWVSRRSHVLRVSRRFMYGANACLTAGSAGSCSYPYGVSSLEIQSAKRVCKKLNCWKIKGTLFLRVSLLPPSPVHVLTGVTLVINTSRVDSLSIIQYTVFILFYFFIQSLTRFFPPPPSPPLVLRPGRGAGTMEKRFSCFKIKRHSLCYGSRGPSAFIFLSSKLLSQPLTHLSHSLLYIVYSMILSYARGPETI